MSRKYPDLLFSAGVAAIILVAALIGGTTLLPVRLLAILLVLLLPGYALTTTLFAEGALDLAERILFSVGLSLAITVLSGFVLHYSGWTLYSTSWFILLSSITLTASLAAALRRRFFPGSSDIRVNLLGLRPQQIVLLGLAGAIAAGAIVVARSGAFEQDRATAFTQLWLLPAGNNEVRIGMRSHETAPTSYRLQLLLNGDVLQEWPAIELKTGGEWEMTATLPTIYPTDVIEALLYRSDQPDTVYRRGIFRPNSES